MTPAHRRLLTALLLRGGFLTAALAIIAGIFGMHVMSGAHDMPPGSSMSMAGPGGSTQLQTMTASHVHAMGTSRGVASNDPAAAGSFSLSSCDPAGSCTEMSAGDAACVLAPGHTTLAAPLPGTAPYDLPDFGAAAALGSTYAYSPGSPSPGDLCISRT
ncbi:MULTISPECIES: hypothetical protein [Micrococcaceae]|uniref:hypothetical protein n=1 Tax=Micrococcaceae TaxID=1268 RepID=UPI001F1A8680|nr:MULTISPECIES: hypothetical protein [Micrococcaceae]UKA73376.1 hypothetical protein LFT49_21515 [Arthrobacter sp. FW306-06-A]WJH26730.1 hypothetical protein JCQ34_19900 [Pseudarthrobacter defluvii]